MSAGRKIAGIAGRVIICILLLAWIFSAIFSQEGKLAWQQKGLEWDSLSWQTQLKVAWVYGSQGLWQTLRLLDRFEFATSLFFMGLTILLGAMRWQLVLQVHGLQLRFIRTLEISMVAQFFNAFLLGSTGGDLLKAYYAARETHHKKTEAVITVFADRLIGLFSMLLFACLMMLPNYFLIRQYERLEALALAVIFMMLACGIIVVLAFWGGISSRWPQARVWLKRLPMADRIERSLVACREFGKAKGFLVKALALSMLLNLACVFQSMTLVKGLDLQIDWIVLMMVVPMIICISALPITPSGLGIRENLYVIILTLPLIKVEATKALSLSLLAYAGFLIWSVLGGLVYLTLRQSQRLDEVVKEEQELETNPGAD